ncbi:MAG: NAD-dependent epimerase/dehydratase family protein [Anaerolineales bacterium]|nr:NAD-dependent epimerase/dehydratase family protein [Anaerolineales bacterium]MCB8966592.1 NAD-dependent epimerase/dehydratase family protein [Ardenticatenaceae bacterium]
MNKVVITGATGFVGGALAHTLTQMGHDVHVLVRPTSNRASLQAVPVTWHVGDITKLDTLHEPFAGADWIIHAAGQLGQAGISEAAYHRINAAGTRNVLQAAAMGTTQPRVMYISSAGVLGPIYHTDDITPDEASPLAPSNPYERSKAAAEKIALEYVEAGLPVIIVRPEFIYGPGDLHVLGLFKTIQRRLFFYIGNGRNTCHPTYIDDAVAGMLLALQTGEPGGIYHITGARPVPFRELAESIAHALDVPPPWLQIPKPLAYLGATGLEFIGNLTGIPVPLSRTGVAFFSENRRSTYQRAKEELGYQPQIGLSEGVQRSVDWYRAQGLL